MKVSEEKGLADAPNWGEHILIVDDEKLIVEMTKEMLENLGYQVTGYTNCGEALKMVRQEPEKFDLVLTDFDMPQMNGLELARELTRIHPDIPIILFSAFHNVVSPKKAREILGLQVGHKIQVMVYENRIELIPVKPVRQIGRAHV